MTKPDKQMMLIDLPPAPPTVTITPPRSKRRAAPASVPVSTPSDPLAPTPDAVPGIMLVDPRAVVIDPVNARHGLVFDAKAQAELIASMRLTGNTVPVRLRPNPDGGYLCPSGSQRLGAALHIHREQPAFRLRAIIANVMNNREAFVIGEADNAGRTNVAPMQQARQWTKALETIYNRDRQAFIAATGRSASVVSRTLALATLPEHVLACCSDVEALTPYFAEQLAPKLADPIEEPEVRRRAAALVAAGRLLPGASLIRALLSDGNSDRDEPRAVWKSPDGKRQVYFRAGKNGGRVDLPDLVGVSAAERRDLVKAFDELIKIIVTVSQSA